ncbi:hypothetical protein L1787_13150 [Acuticoccus sp. M5D2P5]|uniref:hypothetical protein n=1 Tax=Acuticoccus kalidii TaxID=2910977 RepID=UPI001F3B8DC5|nr:hypothetical protein [Acuticoccus kalidii]MCF3934355.1 hypothetical protein [Acuticoccus kalidii]
MGGPAVKGWFKVWLYGTTSVVAITPTAAHADPVSIGGVVLGILAPSLAASTVASGIVGGLLLGALGIAANLLFAPKPPKTPTPDTLKNSFELEEGPGVFAFGRVRAGWKIAFGRTDGYLIYQLGLHYFGPTGASAVETWIYDDREIVVEANGAVSSPPWTKYNGSWMTLKTKIGDGSENAWPELVAAFDGWTTNHRVRGIVQTLAIFENPGFSENPTKFNRLYSQGIKAVERIERAGLFYDPRDPAQHMNNPATWTWTMNAVLIALHFRRKRPGVVNADFDFALIGAAADAADALVETRAGENVWLGGAAPDGIVDDPGGGTGAYNPTTRTFSCTGSGGTSSARPLFRWIDAVEPGTRYLVGFTFTGDADRLNSIVLGDETVPLTATPVTVGGQPAIQYTGEVVATDNDFIRFTWDGRSAFSATATSGYVREKRFEPRARLSGGGQGQITTDFIQALYRSGGLEEYRTAQNKIAIRVVDDYPAAEGVIRANRIKRMRVNKGLESVDRPNVFQVEFYSAERQYVVSRVPLHGINQAGAYTGPDWARFESEIALTEEREETLSYEFCPSAYQAQRLARREAYMMRADTGTLVLSMFTALALWGKRTVDIEFPDFGAGDGDVVTKRCKIDAPRVDDETGEAEVAFAIIPDALTGDYLPNTYERAAPPVLPLESYEAVLDTPDPPNFAVGIKYLPGGARAGRNEVRFRMTPVTDAHRAEINMRTYTGALPDLWQGANERGLAMAWKAGDFEGQKLDARLRYFDEDLEGSYFSDLLEVGSLSRTNNAPGVPFVVVTPEGENTGGGGEPLDGWTVDATAPTGLSVVAIRVTASSSGGPGTGEFFRETVDVFPDENVTITVPWADTGLNPVVIEVSALSSDETASSAPAYTWTPPGP